MSGAPLPLHSSAPDFLRRFVLIVTTLAAVVARRFPANPRLVLLVVPLWRRLSRLSARAGRLMAHLATGRLPRPHSPHRPGKPGPRPLPSGRWWLIRALGHEAAVCGTQLEALLAEPEAAALLAQVPAVRRLVVPLGRLLALPAFAPVRRSRAHRPRVRRPRAGKPRPAQPQACPDLPVFRPTSPYPSAHWPWLARPVRKSPTRKPA